MKINLLKGIVSADDVRLSLAVAKIEAWTHSKTVDTEKKQRNKSLQNQVSLWVNQLLLKTVSAEFEKETLGFFMF